MKKSIKTKNYKKEILVMILLIIVTFFLLLKNNDMTELFNIIYSAKLKYILCGIVFSFIFLCGEALNIRRTLNLLFNYKTSFLSSLHYAFVGFFFSAITPSATGGQPMQVYYMKKDNIEISHSTLSLLMELTSFQLVSIIFAIISILINFTMVSKTSSSIMFLIIVGLSLNVIILIFIVFAIFSNKFVVQTINLVFKVIEKIPFLHLQENTKEKLLKQVAEYKIGVTLIKKNPVLIVKLLITTIFQLTAAYSITYFVYRSLGLNQLSPIPIIGIQSIISTSVSCLPMPGSVGISEGVFLILFKNIYPSSLLGPAMLLSRGINFYFILIVSAIGIITMTLHKKK